MPISDVLAWHAKFISTAREKAEAEAAKELAISVTVAANNALVAARRMEELAEWRFELAIERFEHADNCYSTLEAALAIDRSTPDPPRQKGKAKGKGKDKAHTRSRGISKGKGKGWVPLTNDESGADEFIWQSGEDDDDDDSVPMDQDSSSN